jgi:hypothetical protein
MKNQKRLSVIIVLMITISFLIMNVSAKPVQTLDHNQIPEPTIWLELVKVDEQIDTSAEIENPMVQVNGYLHVESQTPIHVEINLTTESEWTSSIEPQNFTIQVATGLETKDITLTVTAPLGVENGTKQTIRLRGTWSYISGITQPKEIQHVELQLEATNKTAEPNGNGNNDDGGGKDEGKGFLPGFEGTLVVIGAMIAILLITNDVRKRRRK